MIRLKRTGNRVLPSVSSQIPAAFEPLFELVAFAEGQYIPKPPIKKVRVYSRKGVSKPRLERVI